MPEHTPSAPNFYVYSEHRQTFKVTGRTLLVSTGRFEERITESRELHLRSTPESKALKNEFGSMIFRIVENDLEPKRDKNGFAIVGGVNSYPEPVHVVLFVSPDTLALLNQTVVRDRYLITISPGHDLLSWDRQAAVPIYEARIAIEGQ